MDFKPSSVGRVVLHSVVLAGVNLASIIAGFGVYYALRPINQIAVQAPVAAVLSMLAFTAWVWLGRRWSKGTLAPQSAREWVWIYIAAFLWVPVIFAPLHYLTQGYVTGFGNILAIAAFQAPVNLVSSSLGARSWATL